MNRSARVKGDPRRGLPAVDRLVAQIPRGTSGASMPDWAALAGARAALAEARARIAAGTGDGPNLEALAERAAEIGRGLCGGHPRRVINATGIPLHTNLGRAPLAEGAARAAAEASAGYSDLELDLQSGRRGHRLGAVATKLELLTGAAAALAVNNNASAVLLALDTLARGRDVIVSRGELVEIGGSFRVPDIMARAGVNLVEVGTTNRTHPADYANAITPDTALLLKVHRSNFEVRGFVAEASLGDLAEIGREHGVPVLEDLGSGTLIDLSDRGFPAEIFAPARLKQGADVVCFSGDKLLGGPQAGLLIGDEAPIAAMRGNPMARALRLDKLSLAALDWTLEAYLDGRAESEIPLLQQLLAAPEQLEARARALAERIEKATGGRAMVQVERDRAYVGGGSLPEFELDSWVVAVQGGIAADRLAEALRGAELPVLCRVRDGQVILDVRTLMEGEAVAVENAVVAALA
jgi:L-seryl-tRNA(Ser) seleniumtransferase